MVHVSFFFNFMNAVQCLTKILCHDFFFFTNVANGTVGGTLIILFQFCRFWEYMDSTGWLYAPYIG